MTTTDPAIVAILEEYIDEWQATCRTMGLPFTAHDAAVFIAEGDLRNRITSAAATED